MSDIPISAVREAANAGSRVGLTTERGDDLDRDDFLQLLVAQLRYQNPLSPSDPNQFMAQTAQFTMVEKITALSADATAQRALTESLTATGLLGKEIDWVDLDGVEHTGVVSGTHFGSAGITLQVGDTEVPLERVSGARPATATTATTTPPATEPAPADGTSETATSTTDQPQEA
jgi:flagellar basal-body rod modification protein FlgD